MSALQSEDFVEDRFDSLMDFADKAISFWVSIREAAYRHEAETLRLHCPKIRVLTLATLQTVKALPGPEVAP